jgi:large subunit ribosomal protein L25
VADTLTLNLEPRTVVGKGLNGLRREGLVPAVIHDHGKDSVHVSVPYPVMLKAYQQAGRRHPLALKVGSKAYTAMIKDTDFEPRKQRLRHVVFNAIKLNEKVEAEIPVHIVGDVPAAKLNLMVLTQIDRVMVEALPNNLPEELTVDGAMLADVGDKLTVADITAPDGVTIITELESQIAIVEQPKDQIAEADAAKADMEAAGESEVADVASEHGGDTPQDDQDAEDQPGGQEQNQPKGE